MNISDLYEFDIQCHSYESARIDHVIGMAGNGYRLIHQLHMPDNTYLLVFRSFALTKEWQRPIILRDRKIIEIKEKANFLALIMEGFD